MTRIVRVLAVGLALATAAPAFAGDDYFDARDRVGAHPWGLSSIDGRYPRPLSEMYGMNIPAGANAAVPVNVFAIPRTYEYGEAWVGYVVRDAKGSAAGDAKGVAAWDGAGQRMVFGN